MHVEEAIKRLRAEGFNAHYIMGSVHVTCGTNHFVGIATVNEETRNVLDERVATIIRRAREISQADTFCIHCGRG